ncbi:MULTISPECIES: pyrimidine dimer DNA glycosylase/endonuclease V [unclassified Nocardioides]|uniref:pyrimidine dimer DNA glycosylase/endonuclease V n=1 Tax=unclassified Nocardioides TaxID=2615069 RepID=UPI0006FDF90D|nr:MULTISPECIES: pyrimidine dimer DNA glycosylase/endonuclease V [unclassified Nocardioides]KQY57249.1 DNA lyase [Nocardioides sp. Root140]KRF11893.1 DNA lyase [Nocardioides sp. Soil796]
MRVWSLHPEQLDVKGLVACWRETLLAQKVLRGLTEGYRNHPQLTRFRATDDPVAAVATYLHGIADEADARGYNFDRARVVTEADPALRMPVTEGQVAHEWRHLLAKVALRDPERHLSLLATEARVHSLFVVHPGPVEPWEVVLPAPRPD